MASIVFWYKTDIGIIGKVLQYNKQISGKRVAVNKEAATKCHAC